MGSPVGDTHVAEASQPPDALPAAVATTHARDTPHTVHLTVVCAPLLLRLSTLAVHDCAASDRQPGVMQTVTVTLGAAADQLGPVSPNAAAQRNTSAMQSHMAHTDPTGRVRSCTRGRTRYAFLVKAGWGTGVGSCKDWKQADPLPHALLQQPTHQQQPNPACVLLASVALPTCPCTASCTASVLLLHLQCTDVVLPLYRICTAPAHMPYFRPHVMLRELTLRVTGGWS
jgi:hypothetical protein